MPLPSPLTLTRVTSSDSLAVQNARTLLTSQYIHILTQYREADDEDSEHASSAASGMVHLTDRLAPTTAAAAAAAPPRYTTIGPSQLRYSQHQISSLHNTHKSSSLLIRRTRIARIEEAIKLLEKFPNLQLDYDQRELIQQLTDNRWVVHDVISSTVHAFSTLESCIPDKARCFDPHKNVKEKVLHYYWRLKTPKNSTPTGHKTLEEKLWQMVRSVELTSSSEDPKTQQKVYGLRTNKYSGTKVYRYAGQQVDNATGVHTDTQNQQHLLEYRCDTFLHDVMWQTYQTRLIAWISQYDYSANTSKSNGNTLLHKAALQSNSISEPFDFLLLSPGRYTNPSLQNAFGDNPLHLLAANKIFDQTISTVKEKRWIKVIERMLRLMLDEEEEEVMMKIDQQMDEDSNVSNQDDDHCEVDPDAIFFDKSPRSSSPLPTRSTSPLPPRSSSPHPCSSTNSAHTTSSYSTRTLLAFALSFLCDKRIISNNKLWLLHHRSLVTPTKCRDSISQLTVKHAADFIDRERFKFLSMVQPLYEVFDEQIQTLLSKHSRFLTDQEKLLFGQPNVFRNATKKVLKPVMLGELTKVLIPDLAKLTVEYLV